MTGLLDAAEGRHLGGDQAVLTPTMPYSSASATRQTRADIPVEIGGEAELGVVGHPDDLLFALESEDRRQRAKGFFPRHHHFAGDIGDDGRFEEVPPRA